jgi:predicted dehydrogenase
MNIGIIGFGFMGGVHLSAIERIEGAMITAVSSRTRPTPDAPSRGNMPQLQSGVLPAEAKWYYDWRELLKDPDVDAVDICLPTHLHKQVAISALENGKHVLCEKPMALTSSDCDQILEAARKSGRIFMVGYVLRFMFPYRYAATFITSTCLGSVKSCMLKRQTGYPQWSEWLSNEEYSGGVILDLLSHDIDQAIKLFGQPNSVSAMRHGEIDTMLGTLHYPNGLDVQIEGGWRAPEIPFSAGFEITGNDAVLTFENGKLQLDLQGIKQLIEIPEPLEYVEQIAYFIECCRNGTTPEVCPPAESAQAVKLATLLKASREQNGKELSCAI